MAINRLSFGMDRLTFFPFLKKWRIGDVLLLPVVFIINSFQYHFTKPFERQFYINDLTINHPFAEHERVTNSQNQFYSVVVPIVIIALFTLVVGHPKHKLYLGYISILGLLVSIFVNELFTDVLKNWIGRHRPDFIARCIPRPDAPVNVLVYAKDVCTTTHKHRLADGFRTTPSGHSSGAFSGLFYLTLWLSGQLLTEHPLTGSWRKIVAAIPALCAALIALSRTEDYRHHFIDIVLGSLIGIVVAYWSYRRNFPELSSPIAFKPVLDDSDVTEEKLEVMFADNSQDISPADAATNAETVPLRPTNDMN